MFKCDRHMTLIFAIITGAHSVDVAGPPMEPPVMAVPPMDNTADHPDLYIPEPVRHFIPYFYKQVVDKVCLLSIFEPLILIHNINDVRLIKIVICNIKLA